MAASSRSMRKSAMCFALWMAGQPHGGVAVTWQQVADQWAIDRSSAYRWLADYWEAQDWARSVEARRVQSSG